MASQAHSAARKITITGSRLDAVVGLNATRYGVTINLDNPDFAHVAEAVTTLRNRITDVVRDDLKRAAEADSST